MRRAVITGAGIISCLGNNLEEVRRSLKEGRSGIRFNQSYADIGMRSQISGSVRLNTEELIDRKLYRFMGEASAYAYLSMDEAIRDAGLEAGRNFQRKNRSGCRLRRRFSGGPACIDGYSQRKGSQRRALSDTPDHE